MVQLHKKFNDIQVKELIERYIAKKVGRKYVQEILGTNCRKIRSLQIRNTQI